jgi:hypothetical protein
MGWALLGLLLCAAGWRVATAARVLRDAQRRGADVRNGLRWALVALLNDRPYWWVARLTMMAGDEARALLRRMAQEHGLASVANVRCPLCGDEIADALAVSEAGALTVARRGVLCGRCDLRLDACRHCRHFLPARLAYAGPAFAHGEGGDFTHGRCDRYREWQPVHDVYPHMAGRLEKMGYEYLSAPQRIQDSFFPPDECTSFALDLKRLRKSEVAWLTPQRRALLDLHSHVFGSQT